MHEIFARNGIEEWQTLYTEEDIDNCFSKYVKLLNYSEIHKYDNLIQITPLSSGYHIGASNWLLEIGAYKIGILRSSSEDGEFRHPLALNIDPLLDLDVLLVGNIAKPISEQPSKKDNLGFQIN